MSQKYPKSEDWIQVCNGHFVCYDKRFLPIKKVFMVVKFFFCGLRFNIKYELFGFWIYPRIFRRIMIEFINSGCKDKTMEAQLKDMLREDGWRAKHLPAFKKIAEEYNLKI